MRAVDLQAHPLRLGMGKKEELRVLSDINIDFAPGSMTLVRLPLWHRAPIYMTDMLWCGAGVGCRGLRKIIAFAGCRWSSEPRQPCRNGQCSPCYRYACRV